MHLEMAALGSEVLDEGPEVALRQSVTVPTRRGGRQFLSATLTLQLRLARRLLGEEWTPLRLELDGPPLADQSLLRRLFRCPIVFGSGRHALVVRREDMHRRSPRANPAMLALVSNRLDNVGGPVEGLLAQVARNVRARLAVGEASLAEVARAMALSPRTLQRRLGEQGTTFAEILLEVRTQVAREYFASGHRLGLEDLARRLGYGDASAASRFLRSAMNMGMRDLAQQAGADLIAA
jgi:AraC-like DNA-binding protein